jgi:hypothetical protein
VFFLPASLSLWLASEQSERSILPMPLAKDLGFGLRCGLGSGVKRSTVSCDCCGCLFRKGESIPEQKGLWLSALPFPALAARGAGRFRVEKALAGSSSGNECFDE